MFPLLPFPSPREVLIFALVLSRVAGIFSALPVFGGQGVPMQIKVVAIFMITLVCFPALALISPAMPDDVFALGLLLLREMAIGLLLGFVAQVIFAAVEFSGQIIGMQMGFTISQIIDPTRGTQTQVMSVVQTLLASLLFFSLNIHHMFLSTIVDSFKIIPLGAMRLNAEIINFIVKLTADVLIIGVRLAAPVMVSLLLTSVALGIMARAFPQMNIFMISMPLNIGIGFIILGATLTIYFHVLEISFGAVKTQINTLFNLLVKGG
ncbi:MAG: flagellar biosynthetic protein FliR [Geobacteraceae bacterium GWC2_48_7]|nr:MAG: flagellar biosynthetic protein FliR [Geobacteraceae bacterium GWC2_48_7]